MAGHSKWANTRHRKAAQDAKRAKIFTKVIRELTVAAKAGGGNPEDNPKLRTTIDKALAANMKRDTIEKAIARGAGGADGESYDEITYEGYGVGGVAVLVECLTDNRNRTVSEVRHAFSKRGGNLGTDGSVAYLFSRKGQLNFDPGCDEEKIMEVALEVGAEDIETHDDGSVDVITAFEDYLTVKDAMVAAGVEPANAEIAMVPATQVEISSQEDADKTLGLIDMLEDLDDVQNVYTNADIPEAFLGE
ncbi:YebC/PmpR family DNA-binding transcriptional regulator [Teredinibacter turnerae]|uniref:YebC/PmpR family DNA-binding transcriptional regulator n=1 Tax=Teredinibacter turnerae TaxID=2426 RepID=UPI000370643B|nr:YebC/PmpR family DNA-binding transcriptional regulator [Teredinibacter turnerae]